VWFTLAAVGAITAIAGQWAILLSACEFQKRPIVQETEIRTRGEIGEVTGVGEVVRPTCGETYPIDCIALVRGDIDTVAIESGGGGGEVDDALYGEE
jgi:hypothetical protein